MTDATARALNAAARQEPLSDLDALALADLAALVDHPHGAPPLDHSGGAPHLGGGLGALLAAAAARRDRAFPGATLTYSPKVFLPLTNLCRNRCDYCSFRRSPGDAGEWTMTPAQIEAQCERARELGCAEALFCLGDRPDVFPDYRALIESWGHKDTVDYLVHAGQIALSKGLLPHTNAGVLDRDEMARLRPVNVSLGLMLENISPRLCGKGMPHHRAPDKRPEARVAMTRHAGQLGIPFTSGLLLGIGETPTERVQTLLAIRDLHREGQHIQEVIVQNFRAFETTPMALAPEPADVEIAHAVALARLILDDEVSVQAPPNLNPAATHLLIQAGVNDFGGISPLTPDYINPAHPWPHLDRLAEVCADAGFLLRPRLPIYPRYLRSPDHLHPDLLPLTLAVDARLQHCSPTQRS